MQEKINSADKNLLGQQMPDMPSCGYYSSKRVQLVCVLATDLKIRNWSI